MARGWWNGWVRGGRLRMMGWLGWFVSLGQNPSELRTSVSACPPCVSGNGTSLACGERKHGHHASYVDTLDVLRGPFRLCLIGAMDGRNTRMLALCQNNWRLNWLKIRHWLAATRAATLLRLVNPWSSCGAQLTSTWPVLRACAGEKIKGVDLHPKIWRVWADRAILWFRKSPPTSPPNFAQNFLGVWNPTFHSKSVKPPFGNFNGFSPGFSSTFNPFGSIFCHSQSDWVSFTQS